MDAKRILFVVVGSVLLAAAVHLYWRPLDTWMVVAAAAGSVLIYAAVDLLWRWKSHQNTKHSSGLVRSGSREEAAYLELRWVLGCLGLALPFVLALWGFALDGWWEFQPSISDYYAIRARDALVGTLFALAWFFRAYKGYDGDDDRAGDWVCLFALGAALFSTGGSHSQEVMHVASAIGFFLTLSYFCFFLFTRTTTEGEPTPRKLHRNKVYKICGGIIVVCIASAGLLTVLGDAAISAIPPVFTLGMPPVFFLESLALEAFGYSWLIKGDTFWRDLTTA